MTIFRWIFPLLVWSVTPVISQAQAPSGGAPTAGAPSNGVLPVPAETLSIPAHFAAGVRALTQARQETDYLAAAAHFQAILDRGVVHEDVYYNLGNVHFHLNRLGHAVFYFEKALVIHPGYAAARYNLELTRQLLAQKHKDELVQLGREGTWTRLVNFFSDSTLILFFLSFWILLFSTLMALYFLRRPLVRLTLITASVILGLGSAFFGTLMVGREIHDRTIRHAIVLPDQVEVREAPQESANRAFVLHAGHKVRVGTSDRAWVKIQLQNGMEGWLERRDLGQL